MVRSILLLYGILSLQVQAGELLPPDRKPEEVIDHYINLKLSESGITPASRADDPTLLRRLILDLAGRIPTLAEAKKITETADPGKWVVLVDQLLSSPDFAFHHRNELASMLLPGREEGEWRDYLLQASKDNRSWDTMFREVMLARAESKGASYFLREKARDLDSLTNDTSSLFFGVSINCAKCHDHPLVLDWTQDHYFGMYSFFSRTFVNRRQQLGEREYGLVKFKTTEGEEKQARFMFLSGKSLEDGTPMLTKEEQEALDKRRAEDEKNEKGDPPPVPSFSPRSRLVELSLNSENNYYFSRSIVNRIWHRLIGYGLVMPLDQMHSANPPSHPELMDWLARDLVSHGYDVKRLIRGIVQSQVYARSSVWTSEGDPPVESLFAYARTKPLSPRQFSVALLMATRNPDHLPVDSQAQNWGDTRRQLEDQSNGWQNQFELPEDNFQIGVSEALLFSNNERIERELLPVDDGHLTGRLAKISDRPEQISLAFMVIYGRPATAVENETISRFLESRGPTGIQQLVWALICSSEFRFNH